MNKILVTYSCGHTVELTQYQYNFKKNRGMLKESKCRPCYLNTSKWRGLSW